MNNPKMCSLQSHSIFNAAIFRLIYAGCLGLCSCSLSLSKGDSVFQICLWNTDVVWSCQNFPELVKDFQQISVNHEKELNHFTEELEKKIIFSSFSQKYLTRSLSAQRALLWNLDFDHKDDSLRHSKTWFKHIWSQLILHECMHSSVPTYSARKGSFFRMKV